MRPLLPGLLDSPRRRLDRQFSPKASEQLSEVMIQTVRGYVLHDVVW